MNDFTISGFIGILMVMDMPELRHFGYSPDYLSTSRGFEMAAKRSAWVVLYHKIKL
jgi:hypothetical protein